MNNLYHIGPEDLEIFPHQFSSIDYMLSNPTKNILVYQKMGYGKTILSCIFALIEANKNSKDIYIIVPNKLIAGIWETELNKALLLVPLYGYKDNINILTISVFHGIINNQIFNGKVTEFIINKFKKAVLIIDEAHKILDNEYGFIIRTLQQTSADIRLILITATPIINTPQTIVGLAELISNKDIIPIEFYSRDSKVYEFILSDSIKQTMIRYFNKSVLYYFPVKEDFVVSSNEIGVIFKPLVMHKFVLCPFSPFQKNRYLDSVNNLQNPMFSRIPVNTQLFAYSSAKTPQELSKELDDIATNKRQIVDIFNTELLKIGSVSYNAINKCFIGSLFTNKGLLKISCKMYQFIEFIKSTRGKSLCFFQNVDYGFNFIKSVMISNGIQEYPPTGIEQPMCAKCSEVHDFKKTYNHDSIPATFVILTGSRLLSSGYQEQLINIINSDPNITGDLIRFVFISDAFSVGYSFRNFKSIHMLTPRDTETETTQTIARIIRKHIHTKHIKSVDIYLYMAVFGNETHTDKLDPLEYLLKYEHELTIDTKRYIYNELKFKEINKLNNEFKTMGRVETISAKNDLIIWIYKLNLVKYQFKFKNGYTVYELIKGCRRLNPIINVTEEDIGSFLNINTRISTKDFGFGELFEVVPGVISFRPMNYLNILPTTVFASIPFDQKKTSSRPLAHFVLFEFAESNVYKLKIGNRSGMDIQSIKKNQLLSILHKLAPDSQLQISDKKENILKDLIETLKKLDKSDKRLTYVITLV